MLARVHRSSRSAVAPESTAAAARARPSPRALVSESESEQLTPPSPELEGKVVRLDVEPKGQ